MKMRLGTRLMLYFLAALAVVLASFSGALYAMASTHLQRQVDDRLESALNTLAAAAEVGPEGVEWEPRERVLSFGRHTREDQFSWRVGDEHGARVDGSSTGDLDQLLAKSSAEIGRERRMQSLNDRVGMPWRIMSRTISQPPAAAGSRDVRTIAAGRRQTLVFAAGVSLESVRATLRNLALTVVGLSLGLWTLALLFGRRLCRSALRPVTEMADAAQAISGHGLDERLPTPESGDELQELGRSFNSLLDRLRESFERQRRFTGDASHQLRTPLTAIQGQVDLALRQMRSAEEYRGALTLVQRKTRQMKQIVESLLFLARADAEAHSPELEPLELARWLGEHSRAWTGARALDVRLEIPTDEPLWVRGQPALLSELLDNLLDNAAKYSESGSPILVRLARTSDAVSLEVEDSGIGIAEHEIPHIFEPFYRSSEARRKGSSGLGLGLSIASRLARLLGGGLRAQSRPGQGSTFVLTLPLARPPMASVAIPSEPIAIGAGSIGE